MSVEIERQIRSLLSAKTSSQGLSNALFGPFGLFNKLAKTEDERRAIMQTPLFQQARTRITQIRRAELEAEQRRIEEICPPADLQEPARTEVNGEACPEGTRTPKPTTPG